MNHNMNQGFNKNDTASTKNTKETNSTKNSVETQDEQNADFQTPEKVIQHFIPSGINPNNGAFFEGNHNPLSSKGE